MAIDVTFEPPWGFHPSSIRPAVIALSARADRAVQARAAGDEEAARAEVATARELLGVAREGAAFPKRPMFILGPEGRGWLARGEAEFRRASGDNDPQAWEAAIAEFGPVYAYEVARTRWRLAEALAEAGRRDEAAEQWHQAVQIADGLAARPLRRALDDLARRARLATQGTLTASLMAWQHGLAANLAGGSHHAFADHGEGFSVFNDIAVAIRVLQRDHGLQRAAIIDCDVHQGNGTATIFAGDASVFTCSLHGEKNYPFRKAQSSLDIEFPDGTDDAVYLAALQTHLPAVLERFQPQMVWYLAGVDPYVGDQLGRLALTLEGLQQRDAYVLSTCHRAGIPAVEALRVLPSTVSGVGAPGLRAALGRAADEVERGASLAAALDDGLWFDTEFRRLVAIGEASGELETQLERLGSRYERRARRLIERLASLLEPAVILTLAALVGLVVMAAVLPLIQLQEVIR